MLRGRVTASHRDRWMVQCDDRVLTARIVPATLGAARPVTGDWVELTEGQGEGDLAIVVDILPRRSTLSRGAAGDGAQEHVLAANIDRIWIVHALDTPLNPRRLERFLTVAWQSGAVPELLLTKADLAEDAAAAFRGVETLAPGVTVRLVSVEQPAHIASLRAILAGGETVVLLGPSGAGKSTLINALADAVVTRTGAVRDGDHKGRHTTTHRELFALPGGGFVLDTPGIRELRLWDVDEGLHLAFPDIEALADACRYRDCQHASEPGCAVRQAAEDGRLESARLESFHKLRAEAAWAERRDDPRKRTAAVTEHKTALKTLKAHPKYRDRE